MKVEIRNDSVEIEGYVNAVGRESRPLRDADGYFTEIVEPGTFARALQRGKREMLLDHDASRVIGEEGENLTLAEDNIGLYARATVTDPEVIEKARRGELRGWSFGFVALKQRRAERDGMPLRTLEEIDLREVSLIDDKMRPAYVATSVHTRSEGGEEVEFRAMDGDTVSVTEADAPDGGEKHAEIDYQPYFDRIKELRGE